MGYQIVVSTYKHLWYIEVGPLLKCQFLFIVPRQDNGGDCGVFVYLYASNVIKFSSIEITHAKAGLDETPFSNLFTERVDFQFSQEDILKMRLDIIGLLKNLKQLKNDNEVAWNLGSEFKKVKREEETEKIGPKPEISFIKW